MVGGSQLPVLKCWWYYLYVSEALQCQAAQPQWAVNYLWDLSGKRVMLVNGLGGGGGLQLP